MCYLIILGFVRFASKDGVDSRISCTSYTIMSYEFSLKMLRLLLALQCNILVKSTLRMVNGDGIAVRFERNRST